MPGGLDGGIPHQASCDIAMQIFFNSSQLLGPMVAFALQFHDIVSGAAEEISGATDLPRCVARLETVARW